MGVVKLELGAEDVNAVMMIVAVREESRLDEELAKIEVDAGEVGDGRRALLDSG